MTIQSIGPAGAALFCTLAELAARGVSPADLTRDQVLALVCEALGPDGGRGMPVAEVEVYPDPWGVMIFARLGPAFARPPFFPPRRRGRVGRGPA